MILRYGAKCFDCDALIVVNTEDYVPFFNQAKKRSWHQIECQSCKFVQRGARISHSSNSLFVVPE